MGEQASQWLSEYLNRVDTSKRTKEPATFLLVKASQARALSRYAGPTQAPYNVDIAVQAEGKGSPFRMYNVPVEPTDKWLFADVVPPAAYPMGCAIYGSIRRVIQTAREVSPTGRPIVVRGIERMPLKMHLRCTRSAV